MFKKSVKSKIAVLVLSLTMLLGTASLVMAGTAPVDKAAASGSTISPQWMNQFEVTASSLNVRSGPGTSYSVVGTLYRGNTGYLYDAREIRANGYTWVPIYNTSHTALWGWIAKEYIEIIG